MDQGPHTAIDAALAGLPDDLVAGFLDGSLARGAVMSALLEAPQDGPVAACFAMIWQAISAEMPEPLMNLLRWYLHAEAGKVDPGRLPTRAAVHRDVLARVLTWDRVPTTDAGFDLAFVAARFAVEGAAPLAQHREAQAFISRIGALWMAVPEMPVRAALLLGAIATVELGLLRRALDRCRTRPRPPDVQHAVDWALGLILSFESMDPWLVEVIEREYAADPSGPAAVQRKARLMLAEGVRFEAVAPLFHAMRADPAEPQQKSALQYACWQAQAHGLTEDARRFEERLQLLDPGWTLRADGSGRQVQASLPEAPPEGADLDRLLQHAFLLADVDLDHGAGAGAPVLARAFVRLAEAVADAPVPPGWTLQGFTGAANSLRQVDLREFAWITHFPEVPHAIGAVQYGSADLDRIPALHDGLMAVAAAFCEAGLAWAERGRGVRGTLAMARLAQLQTEVCLQMGQPDRALNLLLRLERLGLIPDVIAIERDNCRLWQGAVDEARRHPPETRRKTEVLPLLPRKAWTEAEAVVWLPLAKDAEIAGRFEIVWPEGIAGGGGVRAYDHRTPAGRILTTRMAGLSLLAEDLLIGPAGHAMRPDPYHTSRDYPRPGTTVLAGMGRALRIAPKSEAETDEPVLLLDGFEALNWRNYYHWMIPLLSRIALAQERGLLTGRRLVVPEGLSRWMLETLDLIGLPPQARFVVPVGQRLRCADAVLMTSVEHVSASAITALRRRIMGEAAAAKAPPADGPCLYLSRRGQALRSLVNESEVEELARQMGFTVIAPQDLSVAEQVGLFASARGVAAPEGAALTNTLFSAPGTRVLSFVCANDMMPIYNDLALVLGQSHRKLPGPPDALQTTGSRFQPQFSVDLALARQSLAWVQDGMEEG